MFEMRVHGLGGQGAVTLVTWVAQAGYKMGKHVQAFPFFGAERRGAPVKAFVRIDDNPIDLRSQIYRPDVLVIMSPELTGPALEVGTAPRTRLLINANEELAKRISARFDREVLYLDATGVALDHNLEVDGMPMVNIPFLGAMVSQSGVADMAVVMDVLSGPASRGDYDAYESVARYGFEEVKSVTVKEAVPSQQD